MRTVKQAFILGILAASLAGFAPGHLVAADKLNDGYPDIVFSNQSDGSSCNVNSCVYWGAASNPYSTSTGLPTIGAWGNTIADLDNSGYADIVFSNYWDGTSTRQNSYVYWGAASAPFSTVTDLPTVGAVGSSTADLNGDGYADIVFSNAENHPVTFHVNSYIYWGAASAPYSSTTMLPTRGARGNSVADLNKDGYLDIVFSNCSADGTIYDIHSYIYWGAATNPYSSKTMLPTSGAQGNSVADLNNDGYLDIVFSSSNDNSSCNTNSYIYWGAATNPYSSKTMLPTSWANDNTVADLNSDGYLDIVFSNSYDGSSYNINSYIYWGAATNPYSSKTMLPTSGAQGNSVADLNKDGYLDVVFANRFDGSSYNINSYIYWGGASDPYSSKTELLTSGAMGVSVSESLIFSSDSGFGTVLPLWASENGYGVDILSAWEYEFVALKNDLLNDGALDLSGLEIAELIQLFKDGKAGDNPSPVSIDDMTWSYYGDLISTGTVDGDNYALLIDGLDGPTAWYQDSAYNFYLKPATFEGIPQEGEVPEPSTLLLLIFGGISAILRCRGSDKKSE